MNPGNRSWLGITQEPINPGIQGVVAGHFTTHFTNMKASYAELGYWSIFVNIVNQAGKSSPGTETFPKS